MSDASTRVETWFQEAVAHHRAGNFGPALLGYRKILSRDPDLFDVWANLGALLHILGRDGEAQEACARALALRPESSWVHVTLGKALAALGDPAAALGHAERALALEPRSPEAAAFMASLLTRQGRLEEALELDQLALGFDQGSPDLRLNVASTLLRLGRLAEAEGQFLELLARQPDFPRARWNFAYLLLLQGRYREAWPHFGARLAMKAGMEALRGYREPAWDGRPFPGRTLLVWGEQGLGDILQFVRFLPRVKALGGRVLLLANTGLVDLLRGAPGTDGVLTEQDELPPFDLQAALLDLPALLDCALEELPAPVALAPPADYRPRPALQAKLGGPGRKVGLVWAGNPQHENDARRSLDPTLLAPLASLDGLRWVSLQLSSSVLPPIPGVVDLAPELKTFSDTAYALAHLDALVTVDTAVAHLAGSLGTPTHLLLPFFPDWRWLMEGRSSPWYPSLVIHRQTEPGAWAGVIAEVAGELLAWESHGQ